jgi:hypothetical protein
MSAVHNRPEGKSLKLTSVSPIAGKAYLEAAHKWCLKECPLIVPLFINGLAPIEMMENELPLLRRALLARKAGRYKTKLGQLAEESQTQASYREELIQNTLTDYEDVCKGDRTIALELLYPSSGAKSRDIKRSLIDTQSQGFLQCLMLLWPSEEVRLAMSLDDDLRTATELNDLIAWTIAFDKYCVSNAGNKSMNVHEAESALRAVRMKGYDTPNYVKAFKQAAMQAKVCGSIQSEEDVVTLFFLHMNQTTDAFYRYENRLTDSSDAVAAYLKKPLQTALDHAMEYHKSTILSTIMRRKSEASSNNNNDTSITSVSDLDKLMQSGGSKKGSTVNVTHAVMATLYNNNKRPRDNNQPDVAASEGGKSGGKKGGKANKKKVRVSDTPPGPAAATGDKEEEKTLKCWRYPAKGGCKYGDNCKFAHVG